MKIVVIGYGAGNVFSVQSALRRLGYDSVVSGDAETIRNADRVIFPGVGQASAAMDQLRNAGLDIVISQLSVPVLGICLGMQLMCASTEEGNTQGLGIFPLPVKRIEGACKVPHIGWNNIYGERSGLFAGIQPYEWMYFVHSYYVPESSYSIALCDYPRPFAAAIRKDNFFGCQFHPEKSSVAGENVLRNFLEMKVSNV